MSTMLNNRWVLLVVRLFLGGVFIYAGLLKIQAPQAFADSIASFRLLPDELISLLALTLPAFEVIIGSLLILGRLRRLTSFGVLVLCGIFFLALSSALIRNLQVDCGCFGGGQPSVWKTWFSLGRDMVLIGAGYLLYRASAGKIAPNE
jgi:putative oxidoreductase